MHVSEADIEWTEYDEGDAFFRRKQLSQAVDADSLGCSLYELPAGEQSWPFHYHLANEEAIYVLDGDGMVRTQSGSEPITAGDFLSFPASEEGGHRIVNDSEDILRYLAFSTMNEPDVTIYPEMEKFGVFAGSPPGGQEDRSFHGYFPLDAETEYWE